MWAEFRNFIAKGNVFDLAVGIVIGAAFTTVVNSFVQDILMPPLGVAAGGVDFTELYINLSGERYASRIEAEAAGAATIDYGVFIANVISFLLVTVALFGMVKGYNRMRRAEEIAPAPATEMSCDYCRMPVPIGAVRCGHCTSDLTAT